jgi:hypothetical protein
MCAISYAELRMPLPQPYLLLKFDAVAFWNMDREMYSWTEIWSIIGSYLSREGPVVSDAIAVTIVDVIRQLSSKFLAKQEMTQFHFQRHFLLPFLDIYDRSRVPQIRELILDCVESLSLGFAESLHSGWDVFFRILSAAAVHEAAALKLKAFAIVERILVQVLAFIKPHLVHMMGVIRDFVKYDTAGVVGIHGVAKFLLIAGAVVDTDTWLCLFQNVADCLQHSDPVVRQCAEETVVSIATAHGCIANHFASDVWHFFWRSTLRELVPPNAENPSHILALLTTLWTHFVRKYDETLAPFAEDVFLFLAQSCETDDPALRDYALGCVEEFVLKHKEAFVLLIDTVVKELRGLTGRMENAVKFVWVIARLIREFEEQKEAVAEMMEILVRLTEVCERAQAHSCWCAARLAFFDTLIMQEKEQEAAVHLKQSIELFEKYRAVSEWNGMIVETLQLVGRTNKSMFSACCEAAMQPICQLVEADSKAVRKEVIGVLRRKLGK